MLFFKFLQQDRRGEDSVKYSSLESRFLGDVFKSPVDSENLNGYDGMFVFFMQTRVFFFVILFYFSSV
jgi:hypothetical protein